MMAHDPSVPVAWWLCPNTPRCPHGSVLHDVEDMEDRVPTCTVDGCYCGHPLTAAFLAEMAERDPDHQWYATFGVSFGDPDQLLVFSFGRTDAAQPRVPQPFAYMLLPEEPPSGTRRHYAEVIAMWAIEFAKRFDAGQVDLSGAAGPGGGDPPGYTDRTSRSAS